MLQQHRCCKPEAFHQRHNVTTSVLFLFMLLQVGKELGGGHQGAVYELLDGKGKDSGQVLKVRTLRPILSICCTAQQVRVKLALLEQVPLLKA